MKFILKKIDDKPENAKKLNISTLISLGVVIILVIAIVKVVSGFDFKTIIMSAGSDLLEDSEGRTNFLLIGTGGGIHDGADLTDTMMVASLNLDKESLSMVSIPRDLHVKESMGSMKINEIYMIAKAYYKEDSAKAIEYLKQEITNLTGLDIHYYLKIDFKGFEEVIDAIGGIDIDVKESIYDPFYPKGETGYYEIFSMTKGIHHLDGSTALKYARSRETTSDFSRARRQQDILYAIKDKALQSNILLSQSKLTEILDTINKNFETNLTLREMLTLGAIASDFNRKNLANEVLSDDPTQCGGFLYTPPADLYRGAFVLIPAGKPEDVVRFFKVVVDFPEAIKENLKIQILNGTKTGGAAAETKQVLQRHCLNITRFGNSTNQTAQKTTIYYSQIPLPKDNPSDKIEFADPKTLDLLKFLIPQATFIAEFPQEYIDLGYTKTSNIIVELGKDYTESSNYLKDDFYPLYSVIYAPKPAETETPSTTTTTPPATTKPATNAE